MNNNTEPVFNIDTYWKDLKNDILNELVNVKIRLDSIILKPHVLLTSELKEYEFFKEYKCHIGEERARWLEEEIANNEEGIHVIYVKYYNQGADIIACRSFYRAEKEDTFDDIKLELGTGNYLICCRLVVNANYRKRGYGNTLVYLLNNLLFKLKIAYIIGDSNNVSAINIYKRNGCIVYDTTESGYTRYYYKNHYYNLNGTLIGHLTKNFKPKLIVFEGLDGCGKTTQLEMLKEYFINNYVTVETFANVSDNSIGRCIRELGINPELYVNSYQAGCLYLADLFVTDRKIRECLDNGNMVLCSRHFYSTIIYGAAGNSDVKEAYYRITDNLLARPDVIIYIRMSYNQIHDRIVNRNIKNNSERDVFELEHKQHKYNDLYDNMFCNDDERASLGNIIVVDGNKDKDTVFKTILSELEKYIL